MSTKKAMDNLRERIEQDLQEDLRGPPDFVYHARLGAADHKDKRGRAIKSAIGVILRDRENFHVHEIRDAGDTEEPRYDDKHEREWYKKLLKEYLGKEEAKIIRQARDTNDAKMHHVLAQASELIAANPGLPVACMGHAFKANIDDFRESPARFIAARLARKFGDRINIVEPYARELPAEFGDTGARLVDIDTALETCGILIVLVDHDLFRSIPEAERANALVYDTRGIWGGGRRPQGAAAEPRRPLHVLGWAAHRGRDGRVAKRREVAH